MARVVAQVFVCMIGLEGIEYLADLGHPSALLYVLSWARLWYYAPCSVALAVSLYEWRRAIPMLVAEGVIVGLIASPSDTPGAQRAFAPILIGALIGTAISSIARGGAHERPKPAA